MHSDTPSTAVDKNDSVEHFRITHPFHPHAGREFAVAAWRQNWAEDRVYFEDERKRLRSLPSQWTSLVSDDPAWVIAAGRAHFRVADLLELASLLKELGR